MPDPCPQCGTVHDGDCPESGPASATAVAEPCPWCGERHPTTMKCREWAQQHGETKATPWGTSGFSPLPPPPAVRLERRERNPHAERIYANILRGALLVLALVGLFAIGRFAVDRLGGSTSTASASLPSCTPDRVRQNIARAQTVMSEGNAGLVRRIQEDNSLLLAASADCDDRLFTQYSLFIADQNLCIAQPQTAACAARDAALTAAAQEANSQ